MRKYGQVWIFCLLVAMLGIGAGPLPDALASSPEFGHVHAILVHPQGDTLLVGTHQKLFRSNDAGHTWEPVTSPGKLPGQDVMTLAVHQQQPSHIYAGGHDLGVVRSDDFGQNWQPAAKGLPGADVQALLVDPRRPQQLYAWVVDHGIYRSQDAAGSWQRVADGPPDPEVRALASVNIPTGMGGIFLYAGTADGVWKIPD